MSNSLLTIADYEARAKEIIPRGLFDRLLGNYGAPGWEAYTNNLDALAAIKLRPRVLMDVSHRDLRSEALGQRISLPVMFAPAGGHQRAHPSGELASARAAAAAGTVMVLSTASSYSIEEVKNTSTGPLWFQLYVFRERRVSEILAERAERAGYSALVVTVDNLGAVPLHKDREDRYEYTPGPKRIRANFVGMDLPKLPQDIKNDSYDPAFSWSDFDWLRSITRLPLVIKGIQTAEDARLCVEHGANGLIVSNHGGHDLDAGRACINALPEVAQAVGSRIEVFMDGGIRRGTDVLKALALGAKAVFIGRPLFWGLAVDGEAGARRVLEILSHELDVAMGLCGITSVKNVTSDLVELDSWWRAERLLSRLEKLSARLDSS